METVVIFVLLIFEPLSVFANNWSGWITLDLSPPFTSILIEFSFQITLKGELR